MQERWMILEKAYQLWEDEHPQVAGGRGQNAPLVDDEILQRYHSGTLIIESVCPIFKLSSLSN